MTELDILALQELEHAACERADRHFSIWRFTTNWKAALGTPVICILGYACLADHGMQCPQADTERIPSFPTLAEAVAWAIARGPNWEVQT